MTTSTSSPTPTPLRPLEAAGEIRVLAVLDTDGEADWVDDLSTLDWVVRRVDDPGEFLDTLRDWEPTVLLVHRDSTLMETVQPFRERDKDFEPIGVLVVDDYSPAAIDAVVETGADSLIETPVRLDELQRLVEQELRMRATHGTDKSGGVDLPHIVGESPAIRKICSRIAMTAPSDATTLITGESGTGKELIARSIHRISPRRDRPFVAVNCGAIPENLIESELFGHEKGAFTDATSTRRGRFEMADTGTLFLDEIGELPRPMQVKLLRVLQERVFERVGGTESISVDVRLIAATNQHISGGRKLDSMRTDLFYRLNVLRLEAPPLRERKSDIRRLWEHFVEEAAAMEARHDVQTAPEVLPLLLRYEWPGNVRELENVARHAVALSSGGRLTIDCLPHYLTVAADTDIGRGFDLVGRTLDEIERQAIVETCEATSSVKEAAELLGISERKIYYRLKQYRQDEDGEQGDSGAQPTVEESGATDTEQTDHAPSDSPTGSTGLQRAPRTQPVLLLAEDDDDLRWALGSYLADNFDVISVADGDSLVRKARAAQPDVILSDIRMPGRNPMESLESLRSEIGDIPIVFFSGYWNEQRREQAQKAGAKAFLDKPLDIDNLQQVLQRAADID